jgi:hypothetical protein
MRTIKSLIFITLIFLLCSCQGLLFRIAGLRKPKTETQQTIEKFLIKNGQDLKDVYALDTTLMEKLRSTPFKPGWPPDLRPVQIRVYDTKGDPIMHWASCEGYLKDLGTFDTVPPRNQVNLDSTLNLQQDLDRYFTLDGHPAHIIPEPGYDYYIVIYFAKYFFKMSKASFEAVDQFRNSHPELKIKVYKINIDVLDWWDAEIVTDIKIHH